MVFSGVLPWKPNGKCFHVEAFKYYAVLKKNEILFERKKVFMLDISRHYLNEDFDVDSSLVSHLKKPRH